MKEKRESCEEKYSHEMDDFEEDDNNVREWVYALNETKPTLFC